MSNAVPKGCTVSYTPRMYLYDWCDKDGDSDEWGIIPISYGKETGPTPKRHNKRTVDRHHHSCLNNERGSRSWVE
jgi:hypothetical protein